MAARLGDWVDAPIEVTFVAGAEDSTPHQQPHYTLEGADDKGILLGYVEGGDPRNDYTILFFPWHRIGYLHLLQ